MTVIIDEDTQVILMYACKYCGTTAEFGHCICMYTEPKYQFLRSEDMILIGGYIAFPLSTEDTVGK